MTVAIFFDLEKAFDKTPHRGILFKLQKLKLSGTMINWIQNFLADRKFHVQFNKKNSIKKNIDDGVPQGSCLSPTLFNLYFSDIVQVIPQEVPTALYADDLCIWFTSSSKREIKRNLQKAINAIVEFCKKWGLSINKDKTCYTTFTTAGQRKNYSTKYKFILKIGKQNIPQEPNPTFLGIKLDPKLGFKEHLAEIEHKLIPKKNLLKRLKNFKWSNSIATNTTLYKSLIRSLFDYCFVILNSGTQRILAPLQKIQNKILKIIKHFPIKSSITSIHKNLKLDTISDRANKLFTKFVTSKNHQPLIAQEIAKFTSEQSATYKRFKTPLDVYFQR
jgi:hypothetical protein